MQHFHNLSVYNRYLHKLFNQLIENIQYVNYRNYHDSIAIMIVLLTIDNYRDSKFGCNSQP